jgi:hypothetical protein
MTGTRLFVFARHAESTVPDNSQSPGIGDDASLAPSRRSRASDRLEESTDSRGRRWIEWAE